MVENCQMDFFVKEENLMKVIATRREVQDANTLTLWSLFDRYTSGMQHPNTTWTQLHVQTHHTKEDQHRIQTGLDDQVCSHIQGIWLLL